MAFQRAKFIEFYQLLKTIIQKSHHPEERAVGENFLLEERLTEQRENGYLVSASSPLDLVTWISEHSNYISRKINVYSGIPETFTDYNEPNILPDIDEDQFLVRLENIIWPGSIIGFSGNQMIDYINSFLNHSGGNPTKDIIDKFLKDWNEARDFRPIFAGFWGEVKDIFTDKNGDEIKNDDWANQLRDRFGLGHNEPGSGEPIPVVLLRYRVKDVLNSGLGKTRIAAIPTVLDSIWGPFFFPTPVNGWEQGQTLDLSLGDEDSYSLNFEIIHRFIKYQPNFLFRAGWITDPPGKTCEEARKIHLALFQNDFKNCAHIR